MKTSITILSVELDGKDGVFLTFSDGTKAGYVVEELLALRPYRESAQNAARPIVGLGAVDQTSGALTGHPGEGGFDPHRS